MECEHVIAIGVVGLFAIVLLGTMVVANITNKRRDRRRYHQMHHRYLEHELRKVKEPTLRDPPEPHPDTISGWLHKGREEYLL